MPAITKKTFIEIAADINTLLQAGYDRLALREVAWRLSLTFQHLNPNFDQARFMAACGFSLYASSKGE